ncbi:MAG: hypothetical protein PWQ06_2717 [Anaerophaga sp.]|nr:hypothetical protein [Anaerophaga sp.]
MESTERSKKLKELQKQIAKSKNKNKHYIRRWSIRDGRPFLEEEHEVDLDLTTINFTGCLTKEDSEIYKQFDLDQLAAEQRKEVKNGRQ